MPTVFNGPSRLITLDSPTSSVLNVSVERLYSEWKEWWLIGDNSKFVPAFDNSVGGDPLLPGLNAGAYFFLNNETQLGQDGWRLTSTDEDQTINLTGNLIATDPDTTLILPTAGRSVLYLGLQPITQGLREVIQDLNLIRQIVGGRAEVSMDDRTVTVYDADDVTVLRTFDISADGRIRVIL